MSVQFYYPLSGLSTDDGSVILPSPQLLDTIAHDLGLTINESMDGAQYTHIKTPVLRHLTLTFTEVTQEKYDDFLDFFVVRAGLVVAYLDHEDRVWHGRIINNPSDASTVFQGRWSFTVEFEGSDTEVDGSSA